MICPTWGVPVTDFGAPAMTFKVPFSRSLIGSMGMMKGQDVEDSASEKPGLMDLKFPERRFVASFSFAPMNSCAVSEEVLVR